MNLTVFVQEYVRVKLLHTALVMRILYDHVILYLYPQFLSVLVYFFVYLLFAALGEM